MINFPGYWRSFGDALELRGLKLELREALLMTASLIWNRSHPKPRASDQPCTLQYIIHVPGSRCYPSRVFYNIRFTLPGLGGAPETARSCPICVFYDIGLTFPGIGGAPETARCCSNRVFYNMLLTLPGLGGAAETARCCPNRVFYNI